MEGKLIYFPAFLLVLVVCPEVTSQEFWTFQSPECVINSNPHKHPVLNTAINWIKLEAVSKMSPTFYLAYRGSTWHAEGDCRLKARHLYRVKKLSKHVFGFDPIWPEGSEVIKCSKNFGLTDRSFGFISCAQDEKQASEAAKEWLDSLPFAYTWELVWAGVGVGVLLLVVMVVVLIIRHKRMHQASLRVT